MHFSSQLIFQLIMGTFLMLWSHTAADISTRDEDSLNALYNNLLQREYTGPVLFPNHQVERRAQRSPSLRLRFGRRSDPELISHTAQKRWFDEVNQKPIRSPSLRLRFGRRSDPSMPMHSPLDMIMNEAYENQMDHDLYDNIVDDNDVTLGNNEDELYNSLINTQKLRNILMFLNSNGNNKENEGLALRTPSSAGSLALEEDMNEFERSVRKPGPLRLRWGRSTGGLSPLMPNDIKTTNVLEQKNKAAEISNEVEKTQNKD